MNSARMTVGLLVLAAVLAVAVPTIRNGIVGWIASVGPPRFLKVDEACEVAAEADDAGMRLACAEYARSQLERMDLQVRYGQSEAAAVTERMQGPAPSEQEVMDAYRSAIDAAPQDPAPHLRYAIFLAVRLGDAELGDARPTLTAEQRQLLGTAREQAEQARALAPDNAAPDALLAWAAVAEGDREAALREASHALQCSGFSTYQAELIRGWLRLLGRADLAPSRWSLALMAMQPGNPLQFGSLVRDLARGLRALGDEYRHAGDHPQAILCYETIIHLGRLMRVHAFSVMDGLLGGAVTAHAAGSPDWAPGPGPEPVDAADRDVREAMRTSGLANYVTGHGRADLAEQYHEEVAAAQRFKDASRAVIAGTMNRLTGQFWKGAAPYGLAAWMLLATMLVVGALIAAASAFAQYWREPSAGSEWTYWQWLWCLAIGLMGPIAGAAVLSWTLARPEGSDPAHAMAVLLLASTASGAAGWCGAVWVQTMRRRGRLPEDQRLGRARSWLRAMRALIGPTLAALVLLTVLGIWPVQRNVDRTERDALRVNLIGSVAYYGLADHGR